MAQFCSQVGKFLAIDSHSAHLRCLLDKVYHYSQENKHLFVDYLTPNGNQASIKAFFDSEEDAVLALTQLDSILQKRGE